MKQVLTAMAAVLAAQGLAQSSAALSACGEDADIAAILTGKLEADFQAKLDSDPLRAAAFAAGVKSPEQFAAMHGRAIIGEAAESDLRKEARDLAVVAFGAEQGAAMAATVDALPYEQVKGLKATYSAIADAKFPERVRQTAPANPGAVGIDADTGAAPASKWAALSDDERAHGTKMGYTTDERREAYAANLLAGKGE